MAVELLVEGFTDEVFVRRCYQDLGIEVGTVYGKKGVNYLKERANGFASRGEFSPILILADFMDMHATCPPEASRTLVGNPQEKALVRLAVNEIESWLLASRAELAGYFGISIAHVTANPDQIADPKQALVNLARRSPRSRIKEMFVPRQGVSSCVGEGYVDGFSEFLDSHWNIDSAINSSPSFARFIERSREFFLDA